MSVFKCKMCGGALEIVSGATTAECPYCGTQQTLPKLDDDRKANLYDRANHFRRNNEYDKARTIYEQILNEDNTDAESYWSIILCQYGIEYVEDPATQKRVPTVNRAQFSSVLSDENYRKALEYADIYQKHIYEQEAAAIDEIQKGILAISQKEEPFDVFICYKETDNNGRRTPDSVLANDLYHQLTQEGFKVFFSRITLEDKIGSAYEPYIFAALNSAKVMVAIGTKPEYFNAVWVKNEWSRYLALIKKGEKKILVPAYKDMDPYDLPEEFSHLQAQDMGKLGFMQDLIRGIKKITGKDAVAATQHNASNNSNNIATGNVDAFLKRVSMFLEDRNWHDADDYCEKVLDIDPENGQAYLCKLLVARRCSDLEMLRTVRSPIDDDQNYQKILRFADEATKQKIVEICEYNKNYIKYQDASYKYNSACENNDENMCASAADDFKTISGFKDSEKRVEECLEKSKEIKLDKAYSLAIQEKNNDTVESLDNAIKMFEQIVDWKDSVKQIEICKAAIGKIEEQQREQARIAEEKRIEAERIAEEKQQQKEIRNKKIKRVSIIIIVIAVLVSAGIFAVMAVKEKGKIEELEAIRSELPQNTLGVEDDHAVGLKSDGTVVFAEDMESNLQLGQGDVEDWKDIVAVSTGAYHTVGLKSDGTVVSTEITESNLQLGQGDVEDWKDIVAISAEYERTVGLKSDGTVVATKITDSEWDYGQSDVGDWKDIVAISAGEYHTVGLKSDGTVVATKVADEDLNGGQSDVGDWKDIVAISAGEYHTVGLKSDGTVVATKIRENYGDSGQSDVKDWKDIVAISAGKYHTVGLKSDGTVVVTEVTESDVDNGQSDVEDWKNIVAIYAGLYHTVGLKSDGTVVSTEGTFLAYDVQTNVESWTDILTKPYKR